jgi:hypothetical protein
MKNSIFPRRGTCDDTQQQDEIGIRLSLLGVLEFSKHLIAAIHDFLNLFSTKIVTSANFARNGAAKSIQAAQPSHVAEILMQNG